jgi:D-glycero-D-manno-heptose 1,7-bisphosphate phosphatase
VADRAVFLDRDGVLIADKGHVSRPEDVEILRGVPEALLKLQAAGWRLIVVTNQSGIGRGLFSREDYERVTDRMCELLQVELDGVFMCPHTPEYHCDCRKPNPGLLLRAAQELGIDLRKSVMVGDRLTDVEAGTAAGCRLILFSVPGYFGTQAEMILRLHPQTLLDLGAEQVAQEDVRLLDASRDVAWNDQGNIALGSTGPAIPPE